MNFSVDSWEPAFGVAADENDLEPVADPVEAGVEVEPANWAPHTPNPAGRADSLLFVDGVRRIDASIWVTDGTVSHPGVCATVAAGAVRCNGGARVVVAEAERGVYTAAPGAGPIVTPAGGTYNYRPIAGSAASDVYLAVHEHMTQLELDIAVPSSERELVVFDGPLRGRSDTTAVGYIKTQRVQYLEPELQSVVGQLAAGQRTPLFLIGGRYTRWSCYLRLPGPQPHPFASIVRLEMVGVGQTHDAVERFDQVCVALPRFASEPHKDARAPQNLYPIAGLERELRRRLGDPKFMQRQLRLASAVAAGAQLSTPSGRS